ncbi:hypothetical protein GUJ93_ZPchr0002g26291 [Zizania palustris]|uniref:Uncharacterized protein n=1 Tax=Zizania palustris TaxID=103762 RepID=A0A8J5SP27_ZIZPA|nr:hypothetical protein GUJ93_ZPchr0002g26291 [Zizania palustris]
MIKLRKMPSLYIFTSLMQFCSPSPSPSRRSSRKPSLLPPLAARSTAAIASLPASAATRLPARAAPRPSSQPPAPPSPRAPTADILARAAHHRRHPPLERRPQSIPLSAAHSPPPLHADSHMQQREAETEEQPRSGGNN